MQLTNIKTIKASLELVTGLRIGAGDSEMHIGGVDNTVIKHPLTQAPYIPGSSIKGKMRSLLEWRSGAVKEAPLGIADIHKPHVKEIVQLFGIGGADKLTDEQAKQIGPTRLSFWDCSLNEEWQKQINEDNLPLTEVKSENSINRISGTALNPRQTERVPASAKFDFTLSMKCITGDEDVLLDTVLAGLKLLELDSLGGSGSRGYGKIRFNQLTIDGQDVSARFEKIEAFKLN